MFDIIDHIFHILGYLKATYSVTQDSETTLKILLDFKVLGSWETK